MRIMPMLVLLHGCLLPAQTVTFAARAATELKIERNLAVIASIPAGTDVSSGINLSSTYLPPGDLYSMSCLGTLDRATPGRARWQLRERADVRLSGFLTSGYVRVGAHDTFLELTASAATVARIEIQFSSTTGAIGTATVDVGDDGSVEFAAAAAPQSLVLTMPLAPGLNRIRTHTLLHASVTVPPGPSQSIKDQELTITVTPVNPVVITQRNPPCAAVATLTPHPNWVLGVDLQMTDMQMFSGGLGAFVIGFSESLWVLPITPGCFLFPAPDLTVVFVAPPNGIETLPMDLRAPGLRPVTFFAQGLFLESALNELHGTASWRIDVP